MTPLIQECLKEILLDNNKFPVEEFKWFDIADVTQQAEDFDKISPKIMRNPLPFSYVGMVAKDGKGNKAIIVASDKHIFSDEYEGTLLQSWVHFADGDYTVPLPPCVYKAGDDVDGVPVAILDQKTGKQLERSEIDDNVFNCVTTSMKFVEIFLKSLEAKTLKYHEPIRRFNHAKRIRQGKIPLFDWRTVEIEPVKRKSEHLGGTHASPRLHERRGHWRFIKKSQKKVWVRDCKVGDPSKGIVFHDYKVVN